MNYTSYKKAIVERLARINSGLLETDERVVFRPFSEVDLIEFVNSTLPENERQAVRLRFADPQLSYQRIGVEMGISRTRANQLIDSSIRRFFDPKNGFRVE